MYEPLPGTRMRRRVYLMRHGEVAYFDARGKSVKADHVDLTATGEAQAREMGNLLADVPFDAAYHTGMPRTEQTAQLVLSSRDDVALSELSALREIKTGDMSSMTREEIRHEFTYVLHRASEPGVRFGRGDVIADFYERVTAAFRELLVAPDWTKLLIVAHEGTNRMILGWISGGGLAAVGAFEQDPGCLNVIDVDVDSQGEKPAILRKYIKSTNLTPTNYSKFGNNLVTIEQVYALRRKMMGRV